MLYLEDFLELMEQLPMELRDRFTEMRTLDLEVENGQDKVGRSVEAFLKAAPGLSPDERRAKLAALRKDYADIMEHADEKISLANAMYDLVERYQRKLDEEAAKFRLELEADSPGITAVLEQKVRDSEASTRHSRQERKKLSKARRPADLVADHLAASSSAGPSRDLLGQTFQPSPQRRVVDAGRALASQASVPGSLGPPMGLSLSPMGGPRRDSLPANLVPNAPPPPAQPPPLMNTFAGEPSRHGRQRKPTSRVQEMLKESMEKRRDGPGPLLGPPPMDTGDEETGDQRKWCICNQTSFGEMVACDNANCVFEWFHYGCVGIRDPPKGKWFCPHCIDSARRRKEQQQLA